VSTETKPTAAEGKIIPPTRGTGKSKQRAQRSLTKGEKSVCRYCGSDDVAPSFIKRRDALCRTSALSLLLPPHGFRACVEGSNLFCSTNQSSISGHLGESSEMRPCVRVLGSPWDPENASFANRQIHRFLSQRGLPGSVRIEPDSQCDRSN